MATAQERLSFYIPVAEAEHLRRLARDEGRTTTGLLRLLVRRYMATVEPAGSAPENTAGSNSEGA